MRKLKVLFLAVVLLSTGCGRETTPVCAPRSLMDMVNTLQAENQGTVTWKKITENDTLESMPPELGGSFMGRAGDVLLSNNEIRVIIQQPSRQISPAPYGGNLIDADVIREDGVWHDVMGEISTFIGLSYTMDATRFEIVRDGSDGVLVLRASGKSTLLDYINLSSALDSIGSSFGLNIELKLPWDLNAGIPVHVSNYYVLRAGEHHLTVYTAICNDSQDTLVTTTGDIIDSGGNVAYFNGALRVDEMPGFGYSGDTLTDITNTPYLGFMGDDSGYAVVPTGPAINVILAGVAVIQYGAEDPFDFIFSIATGDVNKDNPPAGYSVIPGGGALVYSRDVIVFDNYDTFVSELYKIRNVSDVGTVSGKVTAGGEPVEGARVAFVNAEGGLENLLITDAQGTFTGKLKTGEYTAYVDVVDWPEGPSQTVTVTRDQNVEVDFTLPQPAYLVFKVTGVDPALGPDPVTLPAKVSVLCEGTCPRQEKRLFADTLYDKFGTGVQVQAFVDHKGKISIMAKRGWYFKNRLPVPPGTYKVMVSRGMEFSTYTEVITLASGEEKTINARIDHVVNTSGYISADLHVHSVNSPDAPVPLIDRVITFMGEGVEVLVSTDHDFITDYDPVIESLGATSFLASFPGEELTTFDVGHFNAYPLKVNPAEYQNGAVDWAGGGGPNLTPEEIFTALREKGAIEHPVVAVNHPRSPLQGYFTAIQLDTDTLKTHADPTIFRMDPSRLNQKPGDTGLFSDNFDAFEIYNAYSEITPCLNDYFTFLNLGLRKTGIAVSDTHRWYASGAGFPRSLIYVGDEYDTPLSITPEVFARAIQAGRVVGTNGPFVHFYIKPEGSSEIYLMGDMVPGGRPLELHVEIRLPEWMSVDTLEIFSNTPGTVALGGQPNDNWPEPLTVYRLTSADFQINNGQKIYHHVEVVNPTADAWYVVVVRDDPDYLDNYPMVPVVSSASDLPFAFTNAIFVDANNNGEFDAPGASLPEKMPAVARVGKVKRLITREEIRKIIVEAGKLSH